MWVRRILLIAVALLALAQSAGADLIGHWTFDEGAGTTAKDKSGNGHDGQFVDGPKWTKGLMGGALELDGVKAKVEVPYWSGLTPRQGATIAAWVFPKDTTRSCVVGQFEGYGMALMTDLKLKSVIWGGDWVLDVGIPQAEWSHIAMTWDVANAQRLVFLNGEVVGTRADSAVPAVQRNLGIGLWVGWPDSWGDDSFTGLIDDVRLYDHILTLKEVGNAMLGSAPELARDPAPENEASDVPADTVVAWMPGEFAVTHDVYFGTAFDDVNNASRDNPAGVLLSRDQAEAEFAPDGIEYGQTYYWRVDEVNAAPDSTIFKGPVWSFTVEPYAYPLTGVTATASSFQPGMGPENTINGSGLDINDQHGTNLAAMWMTPGGMPAWIQYEFDQVRKLDEMWVWNSNQAIESFLGFGAKTVVIEYSADGGTWSTLEGVPEFAKASGTATYTANTVVDFHGVLAKFVKLTIQANWGGLAQTGLSEVRFFHAPLQAFQPQPAAGATNVSVEARLDWRPGREATSHTVFLGADADAVAAGTATWETRSGHGYSPAGLLLNTQYYWKVDEIGDAGTYAGEVWDFTTEAYAVVDDFEGYTDDVEAKTTIWHAWVDGVTDEASGSQVGYDQSPFAERTVVHDGFQAMPLLYSNKDFAFSEAKRTFGSPQDWTAHGIKTLTIHFAGAEGNAGQLYVKINSVKIAYAGDAADLAKTDWQIWTIDLSTAGNVSSVRTLTIGVEGAGATGTLYIDDIRLAP